MRSPEGADALAYLTGPRRCLSLETVRIARLGWTPRADGVPWQPPGIVIPWWNGPRLALAKVRTPDAWRERFPEGRRPPKYVEVFRDPAALLIYPGPGAVRPGCPLILVEGEFDALVLGEALGDLAAVVTLGSASAEPTPAILGRFLPAARWFIATDGDDAGGKAADGWPARARRVRTPVPFKDWTEAKAAGVDLARWWRDILAGIDRPELFTRPELAGIRWGPSGGDPAPGIDNPGRRPSLEALARAVDSNADPYTSAEREAIRNEPALPANHPFPAAHALAVLLENLEARGLRIDGRTVHPRITVGTVTGRVTYTNPPLQTWPAADRLRRIGTAVAGRLFVRADYGQIEPRILHAILRRRGLIAWEAGADLYRDLIGTGDRDTAKVAVNKAINGGRPVSVASGRLAGFIKAADAYRAELVGMVKVRGHVPTMGGRTSPLPPDEVNLGGKAVNRVVQGTAADVFNRAAVRVTRALEAEGLAAAVAFLLYDELWVECDPAAAGRVAELVRAEMGAAAAADGLVIPVRIEGVASISTVETVPP
jgi:DNA polymerase-1